MLLKFVGSISKYIDLQVCLSEHRKVQVACEAAWRHCCRLCNSVFCGVRTPPPKSSCHKPP
jgi:hypothetical protein